MDNEMEVYARLYDKVFQNFTKAGKSFGYKKTTFLCDVTGHPQKIDVSGYLELPNEDFWKQYMWLL